MAEGVSIPIGVLSDIGLVAAAFIGWVVWNNMNQRSKISETSLSEQIKGLIADLKGEVSQLSSKADLMANSTEQSVLAVKERVRKLEETYLSIPAKFEAIQAELKAQQISQAAYYTTKEDLRSAFDGTKMRLNKVEERLTELSASLHENQRLLLQHMQDSAANHKEEMTRTRRSRNG